VSWLLLLFLNLVSDMDGLFRSTLIGSKEQASWLLSTDPLCSSKPIFEMEMMLDNATNPLDDSSNPLYGQSKSTRKYVWVLSNTTWVKRLFPFWIGDHSGVLLLERWVRKPPMEPRRTRSIVFSSESVPYIREDQDIQGRKKSI
jgi:hypothetical protein